MMQIGITPPVCGIAEVLSIVLGRLQTESCDLKVSRAAMVSVHKFKTRLTSQRWPWPTHNTAE